MATRRDVIRSTVIGIVAQACGGDNGTGPAPVTTGTFRVALPAVGSTVGIAGAGHGGQGVAVTRLATDAVVAISRRCTHQGCTVGLPTAPGANMVCPCHGSVYTVQGSVVNGPAPAALASYPAQIDSATNEVVVTIG